MNEVGLYIGRLNPPHNGHLNILDKLTKENDNSILMFGTPLEEEPNKNPLSFEERKDILRKIYSERVLKIIEKKR